MGQLGNGTSIAFSTVPVAVSGGLTFRAVSTGLNRSCGATMAGEIFCWGANNLGQLGIGDVSAPVNVPVAVSGGLTFQSVSVGANHSCGLTTEGSAYCWGFNRDGQLGGGTNVESWVPVAVSGGLTVATTAASPVGVEQASGTTMEGNQLCYGGVWDETAAEFSWTITAAGDSLAVERTDQGVQGMLGWDAGRNGWVGTMRWWSGELFPGVVLVPTTLDCDFQQLAITFPGFVAQTIRRENQFDQSLPD